MTDHAPPEHDEPAGAPAPRPRRERPPVLPETSGDDGDIGWGEPGPDRDADILRERPPHW